MTEADTCREFVTPKLVEAGWGVPESVIGEQHSFTNGPLSDDGLEKVGVASPGTADRNRTLSLGNLGKIGVPLPPLPAQQAFNQLQTQVATLKAKHAAIRQANAALLPATLERIFQTEATA